MLEISIDPTPQQVKAMMTLAHEGEIVMLNFIKFKPLVEEEQCSGAELYARYSKAAMPFLKAAQGRVIWYGKGLSNLIAPEGEVAWDKIILVAYPSKEAFLKMIKDPDYPSSIRTKSLADARLFVTSPEAINAF